VVLETERLTLRTALDTVFPMLKPMTPDLGR